MAGHNRRTFLKLSGSVLGGAFAGSTVVAAERSDRFIVKTEEEKRLSDLDIVFDLPEIGCAVVRGSESDVQQSRAVKSYAPDLEIETADPSVKSQAYEGEAVDDESYAYQWDKQDLDVPTAHQTTKGEGTRLAVIDSGVDASHPDLEVNTDLSRDFTGDSLGAGVPGGGDHGTHVAGIAAAQTAGTTGVAGTAPATDLVDYRVFSDFGGTNGAFSILLAAVVQAARDDCDVANLSLGAYPIPREGLGSFYGGMVNKAMTYANKEGTLLVISAGNEAADLQHDGNVISLPNEGAQALSVAATGPVGYGYALFAGEDLEASPESPSNYTNYGTNAVDLAAPGGDYRINDRYLAPLVDEIPAYAWDLVFNTVSTPLTDDDGNYVGSEPGYAWKAGTSMAAPNVAGAAALVKSVNPDYNANQLESALKRAADVPDGYDKTYYGSGYLNIVDAL
ncbi:S8 family serine peptidase [Halobaculum limi]|uniref:S8 family serine peptidase n=1 Tax=Halobaculum limi TaxID=3031916 RepID=UPI002405BAB2|nr:S8 family serine peptidase [Halobaculum sp. YSMS11]